MSLNLNEIETVSFPTSKTLLECSNGAFVISSEGVIWFTYDRKPDTEKMATAEAELESLNRGLEEMLKPWSQAPRFEIAEKKSAIRRQEKLLEYLGASRVEAQYECRGIVSKDILNKWLEIAKSSRKNNIRSIAYKTGLRFEDNSHNEDIDFDIGDGIITYREWIYTWKDRKEETA